MPRHSVRLPVYLAETDDVFPKTVGRPLGAFSFDLTVRLRDKGSLFAASATDSRLIPNALQHGQRAQLGSRHVAVSSGRDRILFENNEAFTQAKLLDGMHGKGIGDRQYLGARGTD